MSEFGWLDDEVAKVFKFTENLSDFLSGFAAGFCGFPRIDFPPPVVIFCRREKGFEKSFLSWITT